jgi:hypothetical protein
MSRQFRYRVTAMVLGGLIFGAPLLTNGTASAEQVAEGGRQVVFEGGSVFDLSCRSEPDVESLVVPADSRVRVVNRTGFSAKLLLSGDSKGLLADDAATEVVFRRGTTEVLLAPNCPFGEDATPALVTASAAAAAAASAAADETPDPTPAPSGGNGGTSASAASPSAGSPSRSVSGSASAVASRPTRSSALHSTVGTRRPGALRTSASAVAQAATTAAQAMPQGNGASRIKMRTLPRTADSTVPAFAGMPPGDKKAILSGVPRLDVAPMTQDAAPAAPASDPAQIAVAEPVARMDSMAGSTPLGLLGLIAAVCVMGVGVAAIRAIVSQRANRAKAA